jgi:hypothetical protein
MKTLSVYLLAVTALLAAVLALFGLMAARSREAARTNDVVQVDAPDATPDSSMTVPF